MNQNVNKNIIFNTIKTVFGIIYPLITFPYISRVLGAENVGKVNFGTSIVSYFTLFASLGITTYAIRECSKVRENRQRLDETSSQIFSINLIFTFLSYLVLIFLLIAAKPLKNYRLLICIQSSAIIFTTLGADWINSAMEDFKYIAVRTIGMQLVSLALLFIFIRHPEDYLKYALISVIASSGANVINIFYRRRFCKIRFVLNIDWKKHMPPILLMFSLVLSQTVYTSSDTTILGLMKGDYQVGLYSVSVRIYNLINQVVSSIAYVVMPQLSIAFLKKEYEELNALIKYALNFIVILGLPCLVGINAICKEIIAVVGGSEYAPAAISLHILSAALACSFIGGLICNMMLIPSGKENIALRASVVSALLNVILNFILIPFYGLNAAAFTTFISELAGIFVTVPHIDKNIHIDGIRRMLKGPLVGSLLIIPVAIIFKSLFSSVFIIAGGTIIVSIILYLFALKVFNDEFLFDFIKSFKSRRSVE